MGALYLSMAILAEVIGTTMLKMSNGFKVVGPTVLFVIFYIASFYALAQALKTIDMGIAYAIWAAVGLTIVTLIGILIFHEPINWIKALSILFIVIGVVGLRLSSVN